MEKGPELCPRDWIAVTGTLGVILKAKHNGHIALVAPVLEELKGIGFYLSNEIKERLLLDAGEL